MKKRLVAACSPRVHVGAPLKNIIEIMDILKELAPKGAGLIVFPRLCLTGFGMYKVDIDDDILDEQDKALSTLISFSKKKKIDIALSYIKRDEHRLYEENIVIVSGKLIKLDDYISEVIPYPSDMRETVFINDTIENIKNISREGHTTIAIASPSYTESSDRYVYASRSMIIKDGRILDYISGSKDYAISYIDDKYIDLSFPSYDIDENPYEAANHILSMQATALYKRYVSTNSKTLVLGLSGGVDSTMALLVLDKMRDMYKISKDSFIIVTMPCFATSDRSFNNAKELSKILNFNIKDIDISKTVISHLNDISHDINNKNVTYENSQARTRTMTLFDIANDKNGLVVGTGDMSEAALGWSTFNGDQMSNYNINMNLPKTLIRKILNIIKDETEDKNLSRVLSDIIDMPISPELISSDIDKKNPTQDTEDILGPYEVIDYIMVHYLDEHISKERLIKNAISFFDGVYSKDTIKSAADTFFNRYYKMQYKRSATASYPNIGYPEFDYMPTDMER